jgi:hypothetical protein
MARGKSKTDERRYDTVGADVRAALERVLSHAEEHGEVYEGATEDHALLRAALTDEELPGDRRGASTDDDDADATGAETASAAD